MEKLVAVIAAAWSAAQAQFLYLPPAEYDHPYGGELKIIRVASQIAAKAACPNIPRVFSCALVAPQKCVIFLLSDEGLKELGFNPEYVLKHEIAHCNGWPGNHRGARTEAEYERAHQVDAEAAKAPSLSLSEEQRKRLMIRERE
jgi:hypothetical protein